MRGEKVGLAKGWLCMVPPASYAFIKNVDRIWRLFENLEGGMIGLNTGNSSAAESPFGGIKESGYCKESGKDVAVRDYLIEKTGTLTLS